jgi:phosphate-selective porin OprO/OprP
VFSWGTDEELLKLLKDKGIITHEEMDNLMQRINGKKKDDKTLNAYYKNGFYVERADKAFKMKVGGRVQGDYLSFDDNNSADSSFDMRRARIYASGKLYKHTKFKAQLDFGEGKDANLKDGYLNFGYLKWAQVKVGQYKEPFGLEELTSSKYIDFSERSTAVNNLAPSRDIGLMLHSAFGKGTVGYGLGIFNGNGSNNKRDENDDKDVAGRIYFRPFAQRDTMWFNGLQVATSFTVGNQTNSIKDLKTPASGARIVDWTSGVQSDDRRTRFGADLAWVVGPFSLKGEYIRADWSNVNFGSREEDFDIHGWYVTGSYFLTGESKPYKGGAFSRLKNVRSIFDFKKSSWGAWEVVARYDTMRVDEEIFDLGYASGSDEINSITMGLNWYPHNMVTIRFNYVHNSYDDNLSDLGGDDKEDLFLSRLQVEF